MKRPFDLVGKCVLIEGAVFYVISLHVISGKIIFRSFDEAGEIRELTIRKPLAAVVVPVTPEFAVMADDYSTNKIIEKKRKVTADRIEAREKKKKMMIDHVSRMDLDQHQTFDDVERGYLESTLYKASGVISAAVKLSGVTRERFKGIEPRAPDGAAKMLRIAAECPELRDCIVRALSEHYKKDKS